MLYNINNFILQMTRMYFILHLGTHNYVVYYVVLMYASLVFGFGFQGDI